MAYQYRPIYKPRYVTSYGGDNYFTLAARGLGSQAAAGALASQYRTASGVYARLRPGMRVRLPSRFAFSPTYGAPPPPPTPLPPTTTTGGSAPFTSGQDEDVSDIPEMQPGFVAQTSTGAPATAQPPLSATGAYTGVGLPPYPGPPPTEPDDNVTVIPYGANYDPDTGVYYYSRPAVTPGQPPLQGPNPAKPGAAAGYYTGVGLPSYGQPPPQAPTGPKTYVIPFGADPKDYQAGRFAETLNAVGGTQNTVQSPQDMTNPFAGLSGSNLASAIDATGAGRAKAPGTYQVMRPDGTVAITQVRGESSAIVPIYSNLGNIVGWRRDYTQKTPAYLRLLPGGLKQIGGGEGYPDLTLPPSQKASYPLSFKTERPPGGPETPAPGGGGGGGRGFKPSSGAALSRQENPLIQAARERRQTPPRIIPRPGSSPIAARGTLPGSGRPAPFEQRNLTTRQLVTWRGI